MRIVEFLPLGILVREQVSMAMYLPFSIVLVLLTPALFMLLFSL